MSDAGEAAGASSSAAAAVMARDDIRKSEGITSEREREVNKLLGDKRLQAAGN